MTRIAALMAVLYILVECFYALHYATLDHVTFIYYVYVYTNHCNFAD